MPYESSSKALRWGDELPDAALMSSTP